METRVCKCCGRELPVDKFANKHLGVAKTCKECNARKIAEAKAAKKNATDLNKELQKARNLKLNDFTPRELMAELARRGYQGTLTYTETHEINIADF